jgi:hypothetical protein
MITLPPISVNQAANGQDASSQSEISSQAKISDADKQASAESIAKTKDNPNETSSIDSKENNKTESIITANSTISNIQTNIYPQFWMQFRGMSSLQAPEYVGIRQQLGILDNARVTFAWSLGEHFSVGIEAGREPFVLNYQGIKEDRPFVFNQYSPMLTGGLFLQGRTSALDYLGNSRFYAQAVAGGTEIGVLGKFGLGIAYPISNHISLQLGLEQSYMQFQFQGNAFDSQKLDLLYGISIIL